MGDHEGRCNYRHFVTKLGWDQQWKKFVEVEKQGTFVNSLVGWWTEKEDGSRIKIVDQ